MLKMFLMSRKTKEKMFIMSRKTKEKMFILSRKTKVFYTKHSNLFIKAFQS